MTTGGHAARFISYFPGNAQSTCNVLGCFMLFITFRLFVLILDIAGLGFCLSDWNCCFEIFFGAKLRITSSFFFLNIV